MILDNLAERKKYAALAPGIQAALEYLSRFDGRLAPGRYDVEGDHVYALVQRYTTKPAEPGQFEAHRKYIDVQYIHAGRELMLWAPLAALTTVTKPYDETADFGLFAQVPTATHLKVSAGQFAIFFPTDGHIPCCAWDQPSDVLKVVVKVRV